MTGAGDPGYAFAGAADEPERARLAHLEAWAEPLTSRQLDAVGVAPGWRCVDVGAGRGSVTRRLAELVGPSGSVVATDQKPRFLTDLPDNIEVREHDIARDRLEPDRYDLAHTRLVLMHLADPGGALARIVDALRPGGWLVVAEADWGIVTFAGHPDAAWATDFLHDLFVRHERAGIRRPYFGRELPGLVSNLGLEAVVGEYHGSVAVPGGSDVPLYRQTIAQLRSANRSVGASDADLDRLQAVLDSPSFVATGVVLVGMRGRKPATVTR